MARARRRKQIEGQLSIDAFLFPEPEEVLMNTYGKFAQEAWRTTAPAEYALIPDPQEWFERLGEEAAQRVGELMMELAGPDQMGETYLEKVGRLNASKLQAEEIVHAEMLTPDPSVQEEPEEEESGVTLML